MPVRQQWQFYGVRQLSLSVQRIRYPPFEPSQMDPSRVPALEIAVESSHGPIPKFKIGTNDDWFIEWKEFSDEYTHLPVIECQINQRPPNFIDNTRRGWYIIPDPLHSVSRRLIAPTVILLMISLFIHAIEPGLVSLGIISKSFAGSFKFGPLYYPKLLFISFPVFLLPLIFRMIANMRDLRRQKTLLSNPLMDLQISTEVSRSGVTISNLPIMSDTIGIGRARIQVGIAVPERETLIRALERKEGGQPAPGMSTRLPEKRINTGDEIGTGVGEATPMQVANSRVMMLEPLRASESGEWSESPQDFFRTTIQSENDRVSEWPLELPKSQWPGSIYSPLIAVHWELVLECKVWPGKGRQGDGKIKPRDGLGTDIMWVQPIIMENSDNQIVSDTLPVRSGRIEISGY